MNRGDWRNAIYRERVEAVETERGTVGKANRGLSVEGKSGGLVERRNDDDGGLDCRTAVDGNGRVSEQLPEPLEKRHSQVIR